MGTRRLLLEGLSFTYWVVRRLFELLMGIADASDPRAQHRLQTPDRVFEPRAITNTGLPAESSFFTPRAQPLVRVRPPPLERLRVLVRRRPPERRGVLELEAAAEEAAVAAAAPSPVPAPRDEPFEPAWYTSRGRPRPPETSSTRSLPLSRSSLRICRARGCDKPTAFAVSTAVIGLLVIASMIAASRSAAGARPAERRRVRRGLAAAAGAALAADPERVVPVRARPPVVPPGAAAVLLFPPSFVSLVRVCWSSRRSSFLFFSCVSSVPISASRTATARSE